MKLLACVDFTDGDAAVLATLRRWGRSVPLEVWLLHVAAPEPAFLGYDPEGGPYDRDRRAEELKAEREWMDTAVAGLRADGIEARKVLVSGEVVPEILREAARHDVDALVLGARSRSRLQRLLTGSVLKGLLGHDGPAIVLAQGSPGGE